MFFLTRFVLKVIIKLVDNTERLLKYYEFKILFFCSNALCRMQNEKINNRDVLNEHYMNMCIQLYFLLFM